VTDGVVPPPPPSVPDIERNNHTMKHKTTTTKNGGDSEPSRRTRLSAGNEVKASLLLQAASRVPFLLLDNYFLTKKKGNNIKTARSYLFYRPKKLVRLLLYSNSSCCFSIFQSFENDFDSDPVLLSVCWSVI